MKVVRTATEIKDRGLARWKTQDLLRAEVRGENPFPLIIPCQRPSANDLLRDFSIWKAFYTEIRQNAKDAYSIETLRIRHRQLGEQQIPVRIHFATADDFYRFIGKERDYRRWRSLVSRLLQTEPGLHPWIERSPLKVLEYADAWSKALQVIAYFRQYPRPGLYTRQLDIAGVDTKFIETHKGWLRELFDLTLPNAAIDTRHVHAGAGSFEQRFGVRFVEGTVRFRFLDPDLRRHYRFSDLSLPFSEFLTADLGVHKIFITENKINGLSFPDVKGGLVIFGMGYGILALNEVSWMKNKELFYWGDIDTHGFSILSRLRSALPALQSFLMDRATLMAFQELWGDEPTETRWLQDLQYLMTDEQLLFDDLRHNRLAMNLRFEQERIPFHWVQERLK